MQSYFAVRLAARHGGPLDRLFPVAAQLLSISACRSTRLKRTQHSFHKFLGSGNMTRRCSQSFFPTDIATTGGLFQRSAPTSQS